MFLRRPLDGSLSLGGKRIFGSNKTWLGLVVMSLTTTFVGSLIWSGSQHFREILPFNTLFTAIAGFFVVGLAYSIGELPNSFMKRRLSIPSGQLLDNKYRVLFEVIDLIDGIVLAGLVYLVVLLVSLKYVVCAVAIGILVHWLVHLLMIRLSLKKR